MPLLAPVIKTPTLAAVAAALPPEGDQFAPWGGLAALINTLRSPPSVATNRLSALRAFRAGFRDQRIHDRRQHRVGADLVRCSHEFSVDDDERNRLHVIGLCLLPGAVYLARDRE